METRFRIFTRKSHLIELWVMVFAVFGIAGASVWCLVFVAKSIRVAGNCRRKKENNNNKRIRIN